MSSRYKRVNVLLTPVQYARVMEAGLSLSGLIRDLLDDRFSDTKVVLNVKSSTKKMYDNIISNFGAGDIELEKYLIGALDRFLIDKEDEIKNIRKKLRHGKSPGSTPKD